MEERELSSYQANRRRAGIAVMLLAECFPCLALSLLLSYRFLPEVRLLPSSAPGLKPCLKETIAPQPNFREIRETWFNQRLAAHLSALVPLRKPRNAK